MSLWGVRGEPARAFSSSMNFSFLHPQLREKEDRLSELVDGVVEGYHSGFARSIQNYSLILQLFQEAKQQVWND